jgi:hypothetical protein
MNSAMLAANVAISGQDITLPRMASPCCLATAVRAAEIAPTAALTATRPAKNRLGPIENDLGHRVRQNAPWLSGVPQAISAVNGFSLSLGSPSFIGEGETLAAALDCQSALKPDGEPCLRILLAWRFAISAAATSSMVRTTSGTLPNRLT